MVGWKAAIGDTCNTVTPFPPHASNSKLKFEFTKNIHIKTGYNIEEYTTKALQP